MEFAIVLIAGLIMLVGLAATILLVVYLVRRHSKEESQDYERRRY